MPEKKRSLVAHYADTTPSATADTYALMGIGISSLQMAYNMQESTEQYVNEDIARGFVDGYQPSIDVDQIVYPGDLIFDYVDAFRQAGPSIGDDDVTELVEVRLYETPDTAGTSYPATKWDVQFGVVNGPGGDAGGRASISFKVLVRGEQVDGDFNITTKAFTATP